MMQTSGQQSELEVAPAQAGAAPLTRRRRVLMLALVASTWLYTYSYQPVLHNPNEIVRLYATAALVEHGTYRIDKPRKRWGWVNDAAAYKGHFFSVKGPLTTWLAVPGYCATLAISKARGAKHPKLSEALWWTRLSANVLPLLWFLWWLLPIFHRATQSPLGRDVMWLTVALASNGFAYSVTLVSHMIAGACAFVAWRRINRDQQPDFAWFGTGVLLAAVTAAEYTGVILSVTLMIAALVAVKRRTPLLWLLAGAAVPTLLVMHMQAVCFDNPFTPGHLHMENPSFRQFHQRGVFGADNFHVNAAGLLLFSRTFGLFPLSPALLLSLIGLAAWFQPRAERARGTRTAIVLVVAMWFECAWLSNWRGGWTVGPRYLTPALPLIAWLGARGYERARQHLPGVTAAFAWAGLLCGLVLAGLPSAIYPHLPETITAPLPQLLWPAFDGGFAPLTALSSLNVYGSATWAPLALLFAVAGLVPLWSSASGDGAHSGAGVTLRRTVPMGLWFAALMLAPHVAAPHSTTAAHSAALSRGFILENWHPKGHDNLAHLRERGAKPSVTEIELLLRQGRALRAERALKTLPSEQAALIRTRHKALFDASIRARRRK